MKKIINKHINIISITLLSLGFIITSFFSYKEKIRTQEEFIDSSLGFLSLENPEKNELDKFSKTYKDIDFLYKNRDEKILYGSENDEIKIKNYEFNNNKIVKKTKKKFFSYNENLYARKIEDKIFAISFKNPSFFTYIIEKSPFFIGGLLAMIFINKFISIKIYKDLVGNYKELFSSKQRFDEFSDNPKDFFLKLKKNEKDLTEKNKILKARIINIEKITSNMEEGFIYFDKDGDIVIINDQARSLLNIYKNEKIYNLLDNENYKLALRQTKLLKKGMNLDIDLNDLSIKLFIDPIVEDDIVSYIILVIDNSKNKKAELMRREFTANVSHELKSPLTSINGYAELIKTGLAKKEDIKKFAQIINEEGNRLLNIIDDILKLSKLDEENLEEGRASLNVKEVFDKTILRFEKISDKKNIRVINMIDDIRIRTHESLFTDLITNIYENAIKYNKDGGKIYLKYQLDQRFIKLVIEDTGIGIKKEDAKRIFERFFVADKQRTRILKSTGLGLSIVKHICEYLNYDIEVVTRYGYGSKFIISIPKN